MFKFGFNPILPKELFSFIDIPSKLENDLHLLAKEDELTVGRNDKFFLMEFEMYKIIYTI